MSPRNGGTCDAVRVGVVRGGAKLRGARRENTERRVLL